MKNISRFIGSVLLVVHAFGIVSCASKPSTVNTSQDVRTPDEQINISSPLETSSFFTGDGGSGISLGILLPDANGLSAEQDYLPALVQGVLVSDFSKFSEISVLDRVRLESVLRETESGIYKNDEDFGRLGEIANVDYALTGNIVRTGSGYAMQLQVVGTGRGNIGITRASYSGSSTIAELDNFSGIRRASLELLTQMGVRLTNRAKQELSGAETAASVNAQTALARGVTAQRQGTEIAAQSFFYQAAALDPSLLEASDRSSVISANIRSGNIGADVRNDIQWRTDWVARLTEYEEFFYGIINSADPPYTLFYFPDDIHRGAVDSINYRAGTARLDFPINLRANNAWLNSIRESANSVYEELNTGLNATERRDAWQLTQWPARGLTENNPFAEYVQSRRYNFSIVFELVNEQNKVIGSQTVRLTPSFSLSRSRDEIVINYNENNFDTVTFNSVNADDISDKLTIRIASVNGAAPENARFPMTVLSETQWREYRDIFRIEYGVVRGFNQSLPGNQRPQQLRIPAEVWGQAVTAIGNEAFRNSQLTSLTVPNSITYVGERAFYGNNFTNITIGENVMFGNYAFARRVEYKDSNNITRYEDRNIGFVELYESNRRQAGIYTYSSSLIDKDVFGGWKTNNESEVVVIRRNFNTVYVTVGTIALVGFLAWLIIEYIKDLPEEEESDQGNAARGAFSPTIGWRFSF
uniref:Curli production assembly/transport component CsgG n=1 Tax=uncultured bacterium contig00053 TaxID=1181537 RepID=A0A806JY94_9BACT|nr:hypothetical protein [uncultured bacterium contig00053]